MALDDAWQALLAAIPTFVLTTDDELRITSLNRLPGGAAPDDVVGRSILDFVSAEHRDLVRDRLTDSLTTGRMVSYETIGVTPTGDESWYDVWAAPLPDGFVRPSG
ncbi:MAG TPA: PAS domain-containing protein, partial [Vicinamibacteria bacterium]|nr:PAS domain-containing protein [Vicinamibacteria bacterium]